MSEVKGYAQLDIVKLCTSFFSDYITNFINEESPELVTILNDDSTTNESVTERLNNILTKELKLTGYIKDHLYDYVYYGSYTSLIQTSRDEGGHLVFRTEELYNPNAVVIKKRKDPKTGLSTEIYLAIGDDGNLYEVPDNEVLHIGNPKLRLTNDLEEGWKEKKYSKPKKGEEKNRDKVIKKESYSASEPLFYSNMIKLKELATKELLIALITIRDLVSPTFFAIPLII